jgi:uncharacterized protein YjiS (DUF1127 family)
MFGRIKRYQNYRKTVSELGKMTDRELNDIGITRADICAIAREHNKR